MSSLRRLAAGTLIVVVALMAYRALGLPPAEEVESAAGELVRSYGYSVLFAASLLESMFLVGLAFPGTTILVVGVALAPSQGLLLHSCVAAITLGGLTGYSWDYALGRLGWHLVLRPDRDPMWTRASRWVERRGAAAVLLATVHPFLGAPACVSAGVLGMSPATFVLMIVLSTSIWAVVWTTLLFSLGAATREWLSPLLNMGWLVLGLAVAMALGLVVRILRHRRDQGPRE